MTFDSQPDGNMLSPSIAATPSNSAMLCTATSQSSLNPASSASARIPSPRPVAALRRALSSLNRSPTTVELAATTLNQGSTPRTRSPSFRSRSQDLDEKEVAMLERREALRAQKLKNDLQELEIEERRGRMRGLVRQ